MSTLRNAFDALLGSYNRKMTFVRIATPNITQSIQVSPSNYARNLQGPSDTVFEGREFIIPQSQLKAPIVAVKINDRLQDPQLGSMTIVEVLPMYDLDGSIIGYRVRTE